MNYGARHEFLRSLHELLRPETYLEIGVQAGRSLALALPGTVAIGVDPDPQISVRIKADTIIHRMTSDEFFADPPFVLPPPPTFDLAFIDGMHLVEFALRDFMGVERLARPDGRTVAVFDDVLPYSANIAGRDPLPGDWAGDVWKIDPVLGSERPDLVTILVDVDPTGVLVVLGLDPDTDHGFDRLYDDIVADLAREIPVPHRILDRLGAVQPADALDLIRRHLNITEA